MGSHVLEKGAEKAGGLAANFAEGSELEAQLMGLSKQAAILSKTLKVAGTAGAAVGIISAGVQLYNDPTEGNATRVAVRMFAAGSAFIPGIGWGICLGIGIADTVFGDKFYEWIDKQ